MSFVLCPWALKRGSARGAALAEGKILLPYSLPPAPCPLPPAPCPLASFNGVGK
ncbi:hypothetical protein GXM_01050 [Nostoc sphaeroides CCNUC1]|uniref:Uncharacterized protein n=1 Tax=Nostoc sphaeroides CCNUC1 TaxID=2653204 RepID=A0A5P8VT79_9NOSO|nr:hypothetical protein GXM_01050 [Nostoc sphaeroides CCNUC1]